MNDRKELLKSMLSNFINDNQEQAEMDLHNFLTLKSQNIIGANQEVQPESVVVPDATNED